MARSAPEDDRVSWRVRAFVLCFLAAFAVCGVRGIEAWPLTGFQLFSHVRHDRVPGWEALSVDAGGAERPVDFAALGPAYRGALGVMRGFPGQPAERRVAVCEAWLTALREKEGGDVVGVRVYRTVWWLGGGQRERTLSTECR